MRVICPGWFGNHHRPVTLSGAASDTEVSHGICFACLQAFERAAGDTSVSRVVAEALTMSADTRAGGSPPSRGSVRPSRPRPT